MDDSLRNAEEEWDNVKEIVPTFRDANDEEEPEEAKVVQCRETPLITWQGALQHFKTSNQIQKPTVDEVLSRLSQSSDLCSPCLPMGRRRRNGNAFIQDLILVMAIKNGSFCNDDPVHLQILQTLYKQLTGDKVDCPRYGSHWEQIGFQGNDPSTDLRGVGLLGLLHPLFLLTTPELVPFARRVHQLSQKETQDFPLMVLSINLTRIVYDALMDGLLERLYKEDKDFWYHFNFFYSSVVFHYYNIWKTQHKNIKDSGYVLQDTEKFCRSHVSECCENLRRHLLTYSIEEKQEARSNINNRTSVQK